MQDRRDEAGRSSAPRRHYRIAVARDGITELRVGQVRQPTENPRDQDRAFLSTRLHYRFAVARDGITELRVWQARPTE
jgi:hypothetical protein